MKGGVNLAKKFYKPNQNNIDDGNKKTKNPRNNKMLVEEDVSNSDDDIKPDKANTKRIVKDPPNKTRAKSKGPQPKKNKMIIEEDSDEEQPIKEHPKKTRGKSKDQQVKKEKMIIEEENSDIEEPGNRKPKTRGKKGIQELKRVQPDEVKPKPKAKGNPKKNDVKKIKKNESSSDEENHSSDDEDSDFDDKKNNDSSSDDEDFGDAESKPASKNGNKLDDYSDESDEEDKEKVKFVAKKAPAKRAPAKKAVGRFNKKKSVNNEVLGNVAEEVQKTDMKKNILKGEFDGDEFPYEEFKITTPTFARPENVTDAQGNRPDHPDYDPSTIFIPKESWKKFSPSQIQYWKIKSVSYDTIVQFKLNSFYEIYFEDAIKVARVCDVNLLKNKQQCGFWERAFDKHLSVLIEKGFKVSVVEITENYMESMKRKIQNKGDKNAQVMNRELMSVLTKSTYWNKEINYHEPRYQWVVKLTNNKNFKGTLGDVKKGKRKSNKMDEEDMNGECEGNIVSFCIQEVSLGTCMLGYIKDDLCEFRLKMLISQMEPYELVYDKFELENSQNGRLLLKIFKDLPTKPVMNGIKTSLQKYSRFFDPDASEARIWDIFDSVQKEVTDKAINSSYEDFKNLMTKFDSEEKEDVRNMVYSVFSGALNYLESLLISEKFFGSAKYSIHNDQSTIEQTKMVLDSQAQEHLEILHPQIELSNNPKKDCQLKFLDNCASAGGKRLLTKWICSPLMNIKDIENRFDAIEDLEKFATIRTQFMTMLKKLPDLERQAARQYTYSIRKDKRYYLMYNDVNLTRLKELFNFLDCMKDTNKKLKKFAEEKAKFTSKRLRQLFTDHTEYISPDDDTHFQKSDNKNQTNNLKGLYFDIDTEVSIIEDKVRWIGKDNDLPLPQKGLCQEYEEVEAKVADIQKRLGNMLKDMQEKFGKKNVIGFNHSGNARYEFEISDKFFDNKNNKKPSELVFSSRRKDYARYTTGDSQALVFELEGVEEETQEALRGFIGNLLNDFFKKKTLWDDFLKILPEIDCLSSLSLASFNSPFPMSRPTIEPNTSDQPMLQLQKSVHPVLANLFPEKFKPNSIDLNLLQNGIDKFMMLTGPNMGGKSTILRQACLTVILGQIGCYVPAQEARFTIVDRIFTRLGASDRLIQGKSTFFIEMEETANIIKLGTSSSLVIIDELGRGTSTYDGVSISGAVMNYIVNQIKCLTIFATHYHSLIYESSGLKEVAFYKMASRYDTDKDKLEFLYELVRGVSDKSFGIDVAKIAGVPNEVCVKANAISEEFEDGLSQALKRKVNKDFEDCLKNLF